MFDGGNGSFFSRPPTFIELIVMAIGMATASFSYMNSYLYSRTEGTKLESNMEKLAENIDKKLDRMEDKLDRMAFPIPRLSQ